MNELIAYCGLDCGKCEARRATLDNDDALREKVARKWSELNGVEITPAMINCAGCRVDGVKTPYCESLCPIRQCALGRRVETCGGCAEMGACGKLAQITGNNAEARRNLATIRLEEHGDYREVETLVRESFWNVYRPGCMEHYVLHRLRDSPNFIRELDFVMELGGRIIGQNVFVRAEIKLDGGRALPIATMGPICVAPELKRQGYGKRLLDHTLEKAAALGVGAVCFEGNIGFYGKSGFTYAREFGIRYAGLPEGADDSFFLCRELVPGYLDGVKGEYAPPREYFICQDDPDGFTAFEAGFPPKEKLKLPGQLFDE